MQLVRRADNVALLEESHKEAVIGAHFTACNWIRELINAFVLEPDNETKSKVKMLSLTCVSVLECSMDSCGLVLFVLILESTWTGR